MSVRGNMMSPSPSESSSGERSNRFQESWREVNVSVSGETKGKELEGGTWGGGGSQGSSFLLFVFGRVSGWGDWAALVDTSISK